MNNQLAFLLLMQPVLERLGNSWIAFVLKYPEAAKALQDDCSAALAEMAKEIKARQEEQRQQSLTDKIEPISATLEFMIRKAQKGELFDVTYLEAVHDQVRSLRWW